MSVSNHATASVRTCGVCPLSPPEPQDEELAGAEGSEIEDAGVAPGDIIGVWVLSNHPEAVVEVAGVVQDVFGEGVTGLVAGTREQLRIVGTASNGTAVSAGVLRVVQPVLCTERSSRTLARVTHCALCTLTPL
jgi:hypothetical protein